MSCITRCPACATIYRVAQEQLHLADGWLRCGQCQRVFDSTGLVLFGCADEPTKSVASSSPSGLISPECTERIPLNDLLKQPDASDPLSTARASDDLSHFEEALTSFRVQLDVMPHDSPGHVEFEQPDPANGPAPSASHRWGLFFSTGLCVVLAFQLLFIQRHALAARWDFVGSALATVCQRLGCQIEPVQDVDGMVIESASLVRRTDDLLLTWSLRNTTHQRLGMTALELTLLTSSQTVALRKVFLPEQLGAPDVLLPGDVWSGQLMMQVDPALVFVDYRLLSFYP